MSFSLIVVAVAGEGGGLNTLNPKPLNPTQSEVRETRLISW